jgi:hypothetical protein
MTSVSTRYLYYASLSVVCLVLGATFARELLEGKVRKPWFDIPAVCGVLPHIRVYDGLVAMYADVVANAKNVI